MKRRAIGIFGVMVCVALGAGCAKQQTVRSDEPLPAAVATPQLKDVTKAQRADAPPAATVPAEEQQKAQPVVTQEKVEAMPQAGALLSLEKVYFDVDSPALSKDARETLARNAGAMQKDAAVKVRIEGHCDERGSDDYNLALGEKRARAALQYLTAMGVPADQLSVISYGKEKPADPGHDEKAWRANRRDEFIVQR